MTTITRHDFRTVLGHLPTGVSVLTGYRGDEPVGMAINSLTSVSIDPPLILVCPAKASSTWQAIRSVGAFCINVMASHHEAVTRTFASPASDRFAQVSTSPRACGPALSGAVAWIDCTIRDEHEGGDHTIVVADVVGLEAADDASPLVFFRGGYGHFAASRL